MSRKPARAYHLVPECRAMCHSNACRLRSRFPHHPGHEWETRRQGDKGDILRFCLPRGVFWPRGERGEKKESVSLSTMSPVSLTRPDP